MGSGVKIIEVTCFFIVIRSPIIDFNWSQAQVHNEKAI